MRRRSRVTPCRVCRPSPRGRPSAVDERTATFIVVERFHLAIAIVTVIGSAVFLLALMVMLVEERRTTVGTLRLLGFTRRRILVQVTVEGALIAAAGAAAGILFAVVAQDAFNRFFQWRYDTTLIFLRITPGVVWRSLLLAVPLGVAASVIASWTLASPADSPPGSPLIRHVSRISLRVAECRAAARAFAARHRSAWRPSAALLFDMLLLSRGLVRVLWRVARSVRVRRSGAGVRCTSFHRTAAVRCADACQRDRSLDRDRGGLAASSQRRQRGRRDRTGAGAAARGRRSCRPA